ncbi:hypothetical protein BU16DRAFT_566818 [Lophium mytilinum]|uniref:Uncharacterized protein n=1 Tax=Lophium mytilinum TaxID=390894 RepID=A0A6A6QB67_9PEZI|nr:hypothetical protein BU16DRAFT_566818 [Lophium mytilinum]
MDLTESGGLAQSKQTDDDEESLLQPSQQHTPHPTPPPCHPPIPPLEPLLLNFPYLSSTEEPSTPTMCPSAVNMDPESENQSPVGWESMSAFMFGNTTVSYPPNILGLEAQVCSLRQVINANAAESARLSEEIAARDKIIDGLSEKERILELRKLELMHLGLMIQKRDDAIKERDDFINTLVNAPVGTVGTMCCCDELQKERQKFQEELEAKDKKIGEIKELYKKEVAAKDRAMESLKKQKRAEVEGANKRIKALDDIIDGKDLAIQAEVQVHKDLKVQLSAKTREANALTRRIEEMTKEAARLSKLKEKTWQKLDTSRSVATELELKLKREEETRELQVRKGIEEVVAPAYPISGNELRANDLLYETVQAKDKIIEELQSEIAALNISTELMAENEEKLRAKLAETTGQTLNTNNNFTVVKVKKGKKTKPTTNKFQVLEEPDDPPAPPDPKLYDGFTTNTGAEATLRKGPGGRRYYEKIARHETDRWNAHVEE